METEKLTDEQRANRIMRVAHTFIRNVAYYKIGDSISKTTGLFEIRSEKNFWHTIVNNCFDIAVLDWCKLFADRKGKHFWDKIVDINDQDEFFRLLLEELKLSPQEFDDYCNVFRTYRDKFVAHLDDRNIMDLPFLETAINSVLFLSRHLNPRWFSDQVPPLEAYYETCCEEARIVYGRLRKQS